MSAVGTVIASTGYAAQTLQGSSGRLSVRPHEMATGTRNAAAGVVVLDSLPDYLVYVCQQCVGAERRPLVVVFHGGGGSSREQLDWMREYADRYRMIMLLPNAAAMRGHWLFPDREMANIDASMKQTLRNFAIDPDRIAILGMSEGGRMSLLLGRHNLDVFIRVAPLSPAGSANRAGPENDKTEFFIAAGILEDGSMYNAPTQVARELRQAGNPVKQVLMLRPHQQRAEDYAYAWHWLHESWAKPDPSARPAPRPTADLTTVLTADVLTKMTAFWTSFMQEPDSIVKTARLAHQQEYAVHIGENPVSLRMMDMPAMAVKYPAVAANLKKAGLTAMEEMAYRAALISAKGTLQAGSVAGAVEPSSVLGKNIEFLKANSEALSALTRTGVWKTP